MTSNREGWVFSGSLNYPKVACVFFTTILSTRRHPAHPVSALILYPREIKVLWSQMYDTVPCNVIVLGYDRPNILVLGRDRHNIHTPGTHGGHTERKKNGKTERRIERQKHDIKHCKNIPGINKRTCWWISKGVRSWHGNTPWWLKTVITYKTDIVLLPSCRVTAHGEA